MKAERGPEIKEHTVNVRNPTIRKRESAEIGTSQTSQFQTYLGGFGGQISNPKPNANLEHFRYNFFLIAKMV